jgi:hypothetical protein
LADGFSDSVEANRLAHGVGPTNSCLLARELTRRVPFFAPDIAVIFNDLDG